MIPTTQTSVSIDDFKYVATDDRATVTYDPAIDLTDPDIDLTDPDNPVTFTIRVTAEDLSGYSEYVITLKWDFNSVNTLRSLYVENGYMVQTFKPGLYRYDIYEYYDQVSDVFGEYIVVAKYKGQKLKYGYIDHNGKEIIN